MESTEANKGEQGYLKGPEDTSSSTEKKGLKTQVVDKEEGGEEHGSFILLHVQQVFQPYIAPAGPAIYATTEVVESVRKAEEQNSAALFARAMEICKGRAIKVDTKILNGDPKDMICQAAEQIQSDLLVVGSRGLGKIKRAFLGSVSDYCAHHAKCPVLIVKPPK
ncbi:Universal stress protein A [Cinnamomum micranthum f. kanehirae]|uniref:Universal stress protein A n=1 Tax=Cinnamomum micranthum f. kanehirae TaxID=337451 RepID=A0A3S4NQS3_9MAGN|nr:Universal stress protein A [Cinnamomum micranthum f. kanehirae]